MTSDTLHILNGDAIVPSFTHHFSNTRYIVWREALCQGPLDYTVINEQLKEDRIQFLESGLEAKVSSHLIDELRELDLSSVNEVVLWFEYDLFCQINLMAAVSWLVQQGYKGSIAILNLDPYQQGAFVGLGQINAAEYPAVYKNRLSLSLKEISYIDMMWSKVSTTDYHILPSLQNHPQLYNLNQALRTTAVYSNPLGLGAALIESRIYTALKHSPLSKQKLIGMILKSSDDLGYGDTQISYIINALLSKGVLGLKEELIYKS